MIVFNRGSDAERVISPIEDGERLGYDSVKIVLDVLAECRAAHTPRSFVVSVLESLRRICYYDQAIVFFLDVNGRISGHHLFNVSEDTARQYLDYYMESGSPQFSCYQDYKEHDHMDEITIHEWGLLPKTEFITDYINVRGLKYSCSFVFYDLNCNYRVIISLDRVSNTPYSHYELQILDAVIPILNDMHRNFFYHGVDTDSGSQSPFSEYGLTARETEIASLLCQGMNVNKISEVLFIAVTTTYKHIAHIYEKLGVKTQQEFLVKILNKKLN